MAPTATNQRAGPDGNMRAYVKFNLFEFICFLSFFHFSCLFFFVRMFWALFFFSSRSRVSENYLHECDCACLTLYLFLANPFSVCILLSTCAYPIDIFACLFNNSSALSLALLLSVLFQYFIQYLFVCCVCGCNSFHFISIYFICIFYIF